MKIKIGKVLKAQGIKGEVKVSCLLDSPQMVKHVSELYLDGTPYTVQKFRADGACFFVLLGGVADRNTAETLRNADVFCDKDQLELADGRYFVEDIVGCNVTLTDGTVVGKVHEVLQYGAADVYVCRGKKEVSFPVLKDLVVSINPNAKSIVLSAERFAEVALFADSEEVPNED